jgi:hypothetical protein
MIDPPRPSDPFLHHKRVTLNGHTEEIILGTPFARVLIAISVLIAPVILRVAGVHITELLPLAAKLLGHL